MIRLTFLLLFGALLAPLPARAEATPAAPPPPSATPAPPSPAPAPPAPTAVLLPPAPPEPPPAPAGPSPQALATWQAAQLDRTPLAHPPDDWVDARWGVRTGSGRFLTTAEFAAVTGDAAETITLRRRLTAARSQRGWLYAIGGAIELVALTQLAGAGTGSTAEEDHLWRGLVLAGAGVIPFAVGPIRVRAEEDRARHVALNYSPTHADRLIATYNTTLRSQLGIPSGIVSAPADNDEPASEDAP